MRIKAILEEILEKLNELTERKENISQRDLPEDELLDEYLYGREYADD